MSGDGDLDPAIASRPRPIRSEQRWRGPVAIVLIVLTSLSVVSATAAVWMRRQALDTETFVATVAPAIRDPRVVEVMADRLGDELITAVALEDRLATTLARVDAALEDLAGVVGIGDGLTVTNLARLATPITAAVTAQVQGLIEQMLTRASIQELLIRAITVAHERSVALLRGELDRLPNVVIDSGEVRLNLLPVLAAVLRELVSGGLGLVGVDVTVPEIEGDLSPEEGIGRLEQALGTELSPGFGQVTIMSTARLEALQAVVRLIDRSVGLFVALSLVLGALSALVALRRLRALLILGLGIGLGFILGGATLAAMERLLADAVTDPLGALVAARVLVELFGGLRTVATVLTWTAVITAVGVLTIATGWLPAGWRRLSSLARSGDLERYALRHAPGLRIGAVVAVVLAVSLIGVTALSLVLGTALLAGFLVTVSALAARARTERSEIS